MAVDLRRRRRRAPGRGRDRGAIDPRAPCRCSTSRTGRECRRRWRRAPSASAPSRSPTARTAGPSRPPTLTAPRRSGRRAITRGSSGSGGRGRPERRAPRARRLHERRTPARALRLEDGQARSVRRRRGHAPAALPAAAPGRRPGRAPRRSPSSRAAICSRSAAATDRRGSTTCARARGTVCRRSTARSSTSPSARTAACWPRPAAAGACGCGTILGAVPRRVPRRARPAPVRRHRRRRRGDPGARDDDTVHVFPCDVCGSKAQVLRAAQRRVTRELTAAELRRYDPGG